MWTYLSEALTNVLCSLICLLFLFVWSCYRSKTSTWSHIFCNIPYPQYTQRCNVLGCSVLSDSLWPRGLQPARLLRPWDSPGKNTGVGCHSLLQGIFPTQGLIPGLLHCRWILYHLSHQGSPAHPIFSPDLVHRLLHIHSSSLIHSSSSPSPHLDCSPDHRFFCPFLATTLYTIQTTREMRANDSLFIEVQHDAKYRRCFPDHPDVYTTWVSQRK